MPDITVSLTDTENKSLEYAAVSVQEWADNALMNRARIAKVALAVGEDAQVTQAYTLGVVDTAANVKAAEEAESGD